MSDEQELQFEKDINFLFENYNVRYIYPHRGGFSFRASFANQYISCTFATQEQAALAFLYIRKCAIMKQIYNSNRALAMLLRDPYYSTLNDDFDEKIQTQKNHDVDIVKIIDQLLAPIDIHQKGRKPQNKRVRNLNLG